MRRTAAVLTLAVLTALPAAAQNASWPTEGPPRPLPAREVRFPPYAVRTLPNGLQLTQVRVPFGVVGAIYEARPNVTIDIAALALKSGNAVVLRGGSAAENTNRVLVELIQGALDSVGLPADAVQTIDEFGRDGATQLMGARGLVDVLIPRGSAQLIDTVVITVVAWTGLLSAKQMTNMIISSYSLKIMIAIGLTPLIYLAHALVQRGLRIEPVILDESGEPVAFSAIPAAVPAVQAWPERVE